MKRVLTIVAAFLMVATVAAPASAAPGKKAADLPAPAQQSMNADMNGNNLFDNLEEKLAAARSNEGIDVIVQLQDGIEDQALTVLESFNGFSHKVRWNAAINGFAATLNPGQIRAISHSPIVKTVELDLPVQAYMGTATQWTGVNQARTDYGVDGDRDGVKTTYSTTDIVVAIIDTGIDAAHVDLDGGKVIAFRDEVNGRTTAYDDHGHGSHVASIVAGTGEANSAYKGVAPGTALVGVKVLNSAGSGTTTQIVNGVNWVINNKATYNIRIANMSLGASGCSSGTDSISTAVNNANTAGIAMFVAAGNDGPGTCTVGAPGAATGAITVGAGIDPGEKGWGLAYFSSRGLTADGRLKPDIVTPGYNITAAKANSTNQYVAMSGTSMATPFAAGIGALILDANPSYTVTSLKNNLYANVQDWGPAGHDKDYGRGIVLAYNAVKQAAGGTGSWSSGLAHSYTSGSLTATGQSAYYSFTVTDATKPIAVTLINGGSQDFDLYLLNPSGTQVGASEGTTRQEQVLFQPTVTGTYKARIYSYSGTGTYFADISFK